jgi:hypothetical protein
MPIPSQWYSDDPAVWRENAPGAARAITLRHPTYPYVDTWGTTDPDDLIGIAAAYLEKVRSAFGLPQIVDPTTKKFGVPLAWLPVGLVPDPAVPVASTWVRRYARPAERVGLIDRTAILLAVQAVHANDETTALGSRLGIRIVAHVSPGAQPPWTVRITSSSCSIGLVPFLGPHSSTITSFLQELVTNSGARSHLAEDLIRAAARLPADAPPLSIDGVRFLGTTEAVARFDVYASVSRPDDKPDALTYGLTARLAFVADEPTVEHVERCPLVSCNVAPRPVKAKLFPQNPTSQPAPPGTGRIVDARANRSPRRLERYRQPVDLFGLTLDGAGNAHLSDDGDPQVSVMQSKLVDRKTANEAHDQVVKPVSIPHARTNAFAALSGYQHARELFDTMRAYGLSPVEHFKFASLPLLVRYRATIRPGPGKDGKTVNAQVDYDPPEGDPWTQVDPKPLQVRFALADLKRSWSRREPLGVAADPRWSWHEYGHVLLVSATGALEFLFAHSAGDALAAIMWDPQSAVWNRPRRRGQTYPWAYLNRRHDRSVWSGWSWSGTYHRQERFPLVENRRRKGYRSEQILSTSLFRLYRALGGDTGQPDVGARRAAADYTVYLIMRAIGSLGPANALLPETPDQLVTALIDADIATLPSATGSLKDRVGGWAHKVVRWAFEAQGLYALANPPDVVNAPGEPLDVDLFIDDLRPDSEGAHPRGGYMPVSLDWNGAPPPWHASPSAIKVGPNQVTVEVRNRGRLPATGVTVRLLWVSWPELQPEPPKWDPKANTWKLLGASGPQTVPAGGNAMVFGPFPAPPQGSRLLLLAEATCPADRANTDEATGLHCATLPTPIVDLVAGDNNLGLRRL